MKLFNNGDLLYKWSTFVKISAIVFVSIAFFYLGKHWSDGYQQLTFFTSPHTSQTPSVSLSPNHHKSFDLPSLINETKPDQKVSDQTLASVPPVSNAPPPPPALQRLGVLDENGVMTDEFEIGKIDPDVVENWGLGNDTEVLGGDGEGSRVRVTKFRLCPDSMREYIPCLDNVEAIKRLNSTDKGEKYERHCPQNDLSLNCLIPAPNGYKTPIPWPRSRDEVLLSLMSSSILTLLILVFIVVAILGRIGYYGQFGI